MHGSGPGPGPGPRGGGPYGRGAGMFGGGIYGPGGRAWGPGFKFPGPIRPAAGGTVLTGGTFSDRYFALQHERKENAREIGKNSGAKTKIGRSIKGVIGASRMVFTSGMHYDVFKSKEEAADRLYNKKQISALVCKYRKLKAASKYFEYLFNVGRLTIEEYRYEMNTYAESIGVTKETDYDAYLQVMDEEPEKLHSR